MTTVILLMMFDISSLHSTMLLPVTVVLGPTDTLLLELLFLELMSKDQRSEISNINYKGLSHALNRIVIKLQLELGDWQG